MSTRRMRFLVPYALVINAGVQALLVAPDPVPSWDIGFVIGAAVSAAAWLAAYAVVVARAVSAGSPAPWPLLRANGVRFLAWTLALVVVVGVALIPVNGVIGYLLLAVTPYVPIAAMAGARNPALANLKAIGSAPLGYVWRLVVFAVLVLVVLLAVALTAFFVTGVLAAFINSLVLGAVGWLITHSFAREYCRPT